VEFLGGRHNGTYAFGSWGRESSACGGVEHTGNGMTMEDLGCYALVVRKGILHEDERHFGGWQMYSMACGVTIKDQEQLEASESSGGRIWSL